MSGQWRGSDRRARLPDNWESLRKQVHRRDRSQCQVRMDSGRLCLEPAIDVDHIRRGDDHRLENLRCICDWHHRRKSSQEGGNEFQRRLSKSKASFRRTETHPGLL